MTQLAEFAAKFAESANIQDIKPRVVAFGGTLHASSSTAKALQIALDGAAVAGATTLLITGPMLDLPIFPTHTSERSENAVSLVEALRQADGIIIGSPGYHGSVSGLVKNALDYAEDLSRDPTPYFHARPVGAVATGAGWQGAVSTLTTLRSIVHALRGWNTPLGVPINTMDTKFDEAGQCSDERIDAMLRSMGSEVAASARLYAMMRKDF